MHKLLTTLLLTFGVFNSSFLAPLYACTGIIELTSQAEVDAFPSTYGCTHIDGILIISGADITNLEGLSQVESIEDDLRIENNAVLSNLNGLENLTSIGDNLNITDNDSYFNTNSLENLTTIGGSLYIANTYGVDLNGLLNLQSIGDQIFCLNVNQLTNQDGLSNLQSVGNSIYIQNVGGLTQVDFFNNLQSVGGHIGFSETSVEFIETFNLLDSIPQHIFIQGNAQLQKVIGFNNMEAIGEYIYIEGNSQLKVVDGFNNLETIGEYIYIEGNNSLEIVGGFQEIEYIGQYAYVANNPNLYKCCIVIDFLNVIQEYLYLDQNDTGCNSLEEVNDSCSSAVPSCEGNILLTTQTQVDEFPITYGCSEIVGNVQISGEDIANLDSLYVLENIMGNLILSDNNILADISGLNNLNTVGGNLTFTNDYSLPGINGLTSLTSIGGDLVFDGSSITHLDGLNSLTSIGGTLRFLFMDALQSTIGLSNLVSIGEDLLFEDIYSPNLNLDGFSSLETIGGEFVFFFVDIVSNTVGFQNLISVGGNVYLEAWLGSDWEILNFDHLISVGGSLDIVIYAGLQIVEGFNSLESIGGGLNIWLSSDLQIINGFNNLSTIGGGVFIHYNENLIGINGFESLTDIQGQVYVTDNTVLSECCILQNFGNVADEVIVYNNAPGSFCNNYNDIVENCTNYTSDLCIGSLTLTSQAEVDAFPQNYGCSEVLGNLTISGDDIVNVDSLSSIETISGSLNLVNNPSLTVLSGLNNLSFANNILIENNDALTELSEFEALTTIGEEGSGSLSIIGNASLSNVVGFNALTTIEGNLLFQDNETLDMMIGFFALNSVQQIEFTNNDALTWLGSFVYLESLEAFIFNDNDALTQLGEMFPNIESIALIQITNNDALTTINGFDNITSLNSNLDLPQNRLIEISDNPSLVSINGFNGLDKIRTLILSSNPNLNNIAGFTLLEEVRFLDIIQTGLSDLGAFEMLESIIFLNVVNNANFISIEHLFQMGSIYDFTLTDNANLEDCCLLMILENITNEMTISNNAATCASMAIIQESCPENYCPVEYGCFAPTFSVFLEGPYLGVNEMQTLLGDNIPLQQPYNMSPYFYDGKETLDSVPDNMVDWVLVEMRTGTPNEAGDQGTEIVKTKAGLLLDDGNIVGTDGASLRFLGLTLEEEYFICIRHRSHLDILSAKAIEADESMYYDFSTGIEQAWGFNQLKVLPMGNSVMYAGDYNGDGVIQVTDYDLWVQDPAQINVYESTDGTVDGVIQLTDYDIWFENKAKLGSVEIYLDPNDIPEKDCTVYGIEYIFDPANERYLATLDPNTGQVEGFTEEPEDFSYTINTGPFIFNDIYHVLDEGDPFVFDDNFLYSFDLVTGEFIDITILSSNIGHMILNPEDGLVYGIEYIFQPNERYLATLDPFTGEVNRISDEPYDFTYTINTFSFLYEGYFFTLDGNNILYKFNLTTGVLVETIPVDTNIGQLILNPDDGNIYGIEYIFEPTNQRYLIHLDPNTGEVTRLHEQAYDFTYTNNSPPLIYEGFYYLLTVEDQVLKFDMETGELIGSVPLSSKIGHLMLGCE